MGSYSLGFYLDIDGMASLPGSIYLLLNQVDRLNLVLWIPLCSAVKKYVTQNPLAQNDMFSC
jgi:hypothetical protein